MYRNIGIKFTDIHVYNAQFSRQGGGGGGEKEGYEVKEGGKKMGGKI